MTDTNQPNDLNRLESYLDGLMDETERSSFEEMLREHPEWLAEVHKQEEIDAALQKLFCSGLPSEEHLAELRGRLHQDAPEQPRSLTFRYRWIAGITSAAAIIWFVLALIPKQNQDMQPFFEPRPVAEIYTEIVEAGFEPYYECHDNERFQETFAMRQDVPLRLAQLPQNSRMLGLSYPGGLSRDTTAMLCEVDEQPVMVFVDQLEKDNPLADQNEDSSLNVFREVRDGLVFYEVTPLERPTMTQYLVLSERAGERN